MLKFKPNRQAAGWLGASRNVLVPSGILPLGDPSLFHTVLWCAMYMAKLLRRGKQSPGDCREMELQPWVKPALKSTFFLASSYMSQYSFFLLKITNSCMFLVT